jgi:thioredoxin reductase (NADPH)
VNETVDTDVLIVGAGPVGLFGAYYAGFRGLSTVVVDSLPQLGGQISAMYPEKFIHDIAGFPAVRGRDLVDELVAQAAPFAPTYLLGETASSLTYDGGVPVVPLSGGRSVRAKEVIITGGVGKFTPRPLSVGEDYLGRGLAYFVARPDDYAGRDVVVVGGGDSALDWTQALHPLARTVTLVHRRERFRAHEHTVNEVRRCAAVRIVTSSEILALHGNGRIEAVDVIHQPTKRVERMAADAVIAALGFLADLGPLESWGLEVRSRRIVVSSSMATNLPRVYAAGDIVAYHGKVRLIAVGFGEVATAVNNAAVEIDPGQNLFPGHSTDHA